MLWLVKILEVVFVVTVDILPPILDTGVQVWNGVKLNSHNITKNVEWNKEMFSLTGTSPAKTIIRTTAVG